jgi:hypothetical protein
METKKEWMEGELSRDFVFEDAGATNNNNTGAGEAEPVKCDHEFVDGACAICGSSEGEPETVAVEAGEEPLTMADRRLVDCYFWAKWERKEERAKALFAEIVRRVETTKTPKAAADLRQDEYGVEVLEADKETVRRLFGA